MKVTSISFMTVMIRAVLAGNKTQTRRTVSAECWRQAGRADHAQWVGCKDGRWQYGDNDGHHDMAAPKCPYGAPGDLLTVKEAVYLWCERRPNGTTPTGRPKWLYVPMREAPIYYVADGPKPTTPIVSPDTGNVWLWKHKVARFMPRWASRLTLRITDVRVQLLQDINGLDAMAEGLVDLGINGARWHWERNAGVGHFAPWRAFRALWESINGPGSWDANPHVWALTFDVIKANVDQVSQ